jgi:mannose-1-phosphate guanylyltransferase / mannose-6-phosphate isomerase
MTEPADPQASDIATEAVILSGGSGTRLWPLSRESLPKQYLRLFSDKTLLEETIARLPEAIGLANVTIVTSAASAKGEPMVHLAPYRLLLEPVARNTAPAIAIAALDIVLRRGDAVMLVLPADHMIKDVSAFQRCVAAAIDAAQWGALVTFGILPTHPETGYGYIHADQTATGAALPVRDVLDFKEKPDRATAERFIADGDYFWNSGMFVWRASAILAAIATHLPALDAVVKRIHADASVGTCLQDAVNQHFADSPAISIDHGVLEDFASSTAADGAIKLIPADIGWSDIGSWDAVHAVSAEDAHGNTLRGNVLTHCSANIQVHAGERLVAAVGVSDISIIDTPDAVLVTRHGEAQAVRHVVERLKASARREHVEHLTVHRPWGSFTVLEEAPTHKVKRILVKPGGRLSLQSHDKRAEHWVVVAGVATVTNGATVRDLRANESAYIPVGEKHRLENKGKANVELIEVQIGSYFGEDDIKRFGDAYGRETQ